MLYYECVVRKVGSLARMPTIRSEVVIKFLFLHRAVVATPLADG